MINKTYDELVSELFNLYKDYIPNLSIVEGTVENDIFVKAPANALSLFYDRLTYIEKIQLITQYASELPDEIVDEWASQYGIVRKEAIPSQVIIQFYRNTPPDSNITIPLGTIVSTEKSPIVEFETIEEKTMYSSNPDIYYDPTTNKWKIGVLARALLPGKSSNIGSHLLTRLITSVNGIDSVDNNEPSQGGEDAEDNVNLVNRVLLQFRGRNASVYEGVESLFEAQQNITDSLVIDASHPLMVRDGGRGRCIDIYIVGFLGETISETFIVSSTGVIPAKQPVDTIVSLIGNREYDSGVDFYLEKDYGVFEGSTRAKDTIMFTSTGPIIGESITVKYTYNRLLYDLDSLLKQKENYVFNRDALVREAHKVKIYISMDVYLDVGADGNEVKNLISIEIGNYIEPKLGSKIEVADIIGIVKNISGVDNMKINYLKGIDFRENNLPTNDLGDLILDDTQYPFLEELVINIV